MLYTVQGRYRNGHIEIAERPLGVDDAHVLITFLSEGKAASNGQATKPAPAKAEPAAESTAVEETDNDKAAVADKPELPAAAPSLAPVGKPIRPDLSPMLERISAMSGAFTDLHVLLREILLRGPAEGESKPASSAPRPPFGKVDKKIPVLDRSASPSAQLAPPIAPSIAPPPPAPKVEKPEAPRPLPAVALPPTSPLGAHLLAAPPVPAAPAAPPSAPAPGTPGAPIDWFAPRPQRDFGERRGPYIPWFIEDGDLPIIEKRCRLKAEGMRWAAERARRIESGADFELDIRPKDQDIIGRAKEIPNCFLWMNQPPGPTPQELPFYEEVAACFEVLATAVALAEEMKNTESCPDDMYRETLALLAEAQSMLKTAVERINRDVDADQRMVHRWIRNSTEERRVYIERHMNAADPADPNNRGKLNLRIVRAQSQLQQFQQKDKTRKKKFSKVSYIADRLKGGQLSRPELETEWRTLVETVDEMVTEGVPPSSVELRQRLLPLMDLLPPMENPPQGFERTIREIDRYRQLNAAAKVKAEEEEADEAPTEEVRQVAEMLRGRTLVLIGGERREHAVRKLCQALGLDDVDWVDTASKPSFHSFESHVSAPSVGVVILAIRWSSHSYANVQMYCQKHDKPLVRLPAGYGVNQVAHAIMEQVGERLASAAGIVRSVPEAAEAKPQRDFAKEAAKETVQAKGVEAEPAAVKAEEEKAVEAKASKNGNGLKAPAAAPDGNGLKKPAVKKPANGKGARAARAARETVTQEAVPEAAPETTVPEPHQPEALDTVYSADTVVEASAAAPIELPVQHSDERAEGSQETSAAEPQQTREVAEAAV